MLTTSEYQTLVEQAPIMIWRAGTDMLCDYFNARWLEFTGRAMEQELGNGWAEGVHAEDYQRCLDTYVSHFERRAVFEMVYRLRRHDGAWRWIFDRGVPYHSGDGEFAGYIGSCIDVTEKTEAETALNAAREKEVARLQRLLPMCAWCGKIRTDDGYWKEVATYLASEKLGTVTHGMCQSCYEREGFK